MSIYSPSHQASNALNGIGDMSDGQGTINPAALNSGGMSPWSSCPSRDLRPAACVLQGANSACVTAVLPPNPLEPSPRGIKRSRSPEHEYGEYLHPDDEGKHG
jgi:hypothetical protein